MKNRVVRFLLTLNLTAVGAILVSHSAAFHSVDAQASIKSAFQDAQLPDDQINQIRDKIHTYIAKDEQIKGCFLLLDSASDKVLRLKFDLLPAPIRHVQETLESGRIDTYKVATAVFKDPHGKEVLVDFYMQLGGPAIGQDRGNWWSIVKIRVAQPAWK